MLASMHVRTGCDVQSVADVAHALDRFGDRYLARVYTAGERVAHARPGSAGAATLAARFAAKEAVMKLIGVADGVDLRSIEVTQDVGGRPGVRLHAEAADLARRAGLGPIDLSLSHADDVAFAVAVALAAGGAAADTPHNAPAGGPPAPSPAHRPDPAPSSPPDQERTP